MSNSFETYVKSFTDRTLGLSIDKVHQIIAHNLCKKVNSVIARVHDSHHKKRVTEGRPPLPLPDSDRHFISTDIFERSIASAGFDTDAWIKVLRDEANAHHERYREEHGSKIDSMNYHQVGDVVVNREAFVVDLEAVPFGSARAGASLEEVTRVITQTGKIENIMEAFAVEGLKAGSGAVGESLLASGAAAFGPIAVGIATLIILPLIIEGLFGASTAELHAQIRLEHELHEQALRNLQVERARALNDLAKFDTIVEEINEKADKKNQKRKDDKKRRDEEEEERKKKKKTFLGCVERIERIERPRAPFDSLNITPEESQVEKLGQLSLANTTSGHDMVTNENGGDPYEIRMSAMSYTQITERSAAAQILGSGDLHLQRLLPHVGADIVLCSALYKELPQGIDVGSYVTFDVQKDTWEVSDGDFPVKPSENFDDGRAMIEIYTPTIGYLRSQLTYTAYNAHGFDGLVTDLQATSATFARGLLDHVNGALNKTEKIIEYGLNMLMRGSEPSVQNWLQANPKLTATYTPNLMASNKNDKDKTLYTKEEIQDLLKQKHRKPMATNISIADIGQGASQVVGNEDVDLFISDFGYGRGPGDVMDRVKEVFNWDLDVPVILSHWDRDHYGIACSHFAREELDKPRPDQYLPWKRTWIVPQLITGILANYVRGQIKGQGRLVEFPLAQTDVKWGNITISNCNKIHGASKVDKNNNGALAFWFGDNKKGYVYYPGDANYEAINTPQSIQGKISVMIATHHGSMRSITPSGRPVGATIPLANSEANVFVYTGKWNPIKYRMPVSVFSYGLGNSYHHDVGIAGPYYKIRGYENLIATEDLDGGNADDGVCYFIEPLNMGDLPKGPRKRKIANQVLIDAAFKTTQEDDRDPKEDVSTIRANISLGHFAKEIVLTNSDLSNHAVNVYGVTERYNVLTEKLKITAPLRVTCDQDFSVPVVLQCKDLDVQFTDTSNTLIIFDVASGPDWEGSAAAGKPGREGKPAYIGGYLDLRVSGSWSLKSKDGQPIFSSDGSGDTTDCPIVIRYTGGQGGRGQQGGRGSRGKDGANGMDDQSGAVKGKAAEKGGMGGKGAVGGVGGQPATFSISRILATKDMIQRESTKITFDIRTETFGQGGKGGAGKASFPKQAR
ncbi:hypothetical protein F5Y19DRAFT_458193 [Xylariaceae sp. FL1651]|nr:hypothetical protein F5Y19DRAFT_458193 [Xylariaceae sp. FL1651]